MTNEEKTVVTALLEAWECYKRTAVHEWSTDWEQDLANLTLEKEEWKKQLGLTPTD